jgi:23S rRNA (adenine2030-N6)-methyltransferase
MLSYQHLYHAGNRADVHKHALLAWMLAYLAAEPKPLSYIETHAGRGLYDLAAPEAEKTGEAAAGIGRLLPRFSAAHPYAQAIAATRAAHGASAYPGSPLIAAQVARPGDRLHLAELHPQEHAALRAALGRRAKVRRTDGFALAQSLAPPEPRRGMLFCDPSYEVKADYERLPDFLAGIARKWNVGGLVLWYPILPGEPQREMVATLTSTFPPALRSEVRFPQLRPGKGILGSGLFVVNPPWGLAEEARVVEALVAAD